MTVIGESNMANPLAGCVNSLQSSISLLSSSIAILDTGVNDFPRLGKVLQTTRVSGSCFHRILMLSPTLPFFYPLLLPSRSSS